jgi:hypothetical protein
MCQRDELFRLTQSIIDTGSIEQRNAVWEWVTRAVPNDLVPKDFMKVWNECDVLVWIDHTETFSRYFK